MNFGVVLPEYLRVGLIKTVSKSEPQAWKGWEALI